MAKQTYIVRSDRHRVVHYDKDRNVTGSTIYNKGDEITLEEGKAKRLVDTGGLVLKTEDAEDTDTVINAAGQPVTAAPVPVVALESDTEPDAEVPGEPVNPAAQSGQTADSGVKNEDASGADSTAPKANDYEAMEYTDLRALAKDRDLATNGSKPDLVARLTEADQASAEDKS